MGNALSVIKLSLMYETPIITILGCTGTGKSKLAIEISKHFNGEIISADSMQVYKGLNIVTNKVTLEEQKEAVHHCIDFVDILSRFTVVDFQNQVLPVIDSIIERKKLPIIVGGTNYYIESLLWDILLPKKIKTRDLLFDEELLSEKNSFHPPCQVSLDTSKLFVKKITTDSLQEFPGTYLHKCLHEVDPAMANALHPEDKRKIIRSLQVFQQHGRLHSEILREQHSKLGGSSIGGPLRFKRPVMLWLQCDKKVLDRRLDDRVDDMIERGLISELMDFHRSYNKERIDVQKPHYTEGIFQSIGFKEFHKYLVLPDEEKDLTTGKKLLEQAIEEMKLATRQYARKQTKWIKNRFLRKKDRQCPPVYSLSVTDLEKWNENVLQPAINIVQSVIMGNPPAQSPLYTDDYVEDIKETYFCEICERVIVGQRTWKIHLNSRKHYKRKSSLKASQTNLKQSLNTE